MLRLKFSKSAYLASALLALSLALLPGHSNGQQNNAESRQPSTPPAVGSVVRQEKLDHLYRELKSTTNQNHAIGLEREIWSIWLHHGNPEIDALMSDVLAARRQSNYDKAISLTSRIIELAPDYAEGWNQRAIILFMQESYDASLRDVAETLRREPNHFGALSGRAVIRIRQGKSGLAIQNLLEALKVNPHLRERGLLPALGYREADT